MEDIIECTGKAEEYEGACLVLRYGAVVETIGLGYEDLSRAQGEYGLDPSKAGGWLCARRIFNDPSQADRFVTALRLASEEVKVRADVTRHELSQFVKDGLGDRAEGPFYRISRWVESRIALNHHSWLMKQPRTTLKLGGQPDWWQPRPNPRDPRSGNPMVPLLQFSGDLDKVLPGDEKARYYVFGPSDFEGVDGRYKVFWQNEGRPSAHYRFLVREEPAGFAVVVTDFVQMTPDPVLGPKLTDKFHKAIMIWKSKPGDSGEVIWTPYEGDVTDAAQEMMISVAGLEDEGYRVEAGSEVFKQPWLRESLRRLTMQLGRPDTIPSRLFFHGKELEYVHLYGGYTLWTNVEFASVEDDIMTRHWPGIGGEPEAVTGLVKQRGRFGEGELVPVVTFVPDESLDHPHIDYGEQGLVYIAIPREIYGARIGQVLSQSL